MAIHPVPDSTYVFCPPPPGKPDHNEKYDSSSGKPRQRIILPGQKGDTCSFFAMQIVRNDRKIGKHPIESQLSERAIEKNISMFRKMLTIVNKVKWKIGFADEVTKCLGGESTRKKVYQYLDQLVNQITSDHDVCINALKSFCNQEKYDDFNRFIKDEYIQACIGVHELFMQTFRVPNETIQSSIPKYFNKTWEQLNIEEQHWHFDNLAFQVSFHLYGFQRSLWHPEKSIKILIEQLQLNGPYIVKGKFGQLFYQDPPIELKGHVENRSVFGWRPNAIRINDDIPGYHAIVIVGAKIDEKKEYVYFIDPVDGSDPNDITTQKIYVMSYARLQSSIANLSSLAFESNGKRFFESIQVTENNYAIYLPKPDIEKSAEIESGQLPRDTMLFENFLARN